MGWFGKRAGREGARPVLARGFGGAALGAWPSGYEAQVREAFLGNAVAQRAVRLVSEAVAAAPIYSSGDDAAPVALVRRSAVLGTVAAQLLLHGNAYLQLLGDDSGAPEGLFALRPERVSVAVDGRGWPEGYLYRVDGQVMRLSAERVVHVRSFHPLDDHLGLGCLGAASGAVAIHNAATRWHKALLDNAARPSGALVYDPGERGASLSNEQFERLRGEMEQSFAGAANAGRPMLLDGGLKWQAMSLTPADLDFTASKAAAAREIALAFGVPPMLLGLPGDATYANYREANRALWRSTVLPLAGQILGAVAERLAAWWPGLTIEVDPDLVPALAEDRERLWRQVAGADFLTRDEKRGMVGF